MSESRSSGKLVMADFYTSWCGWCKKLDKDTYSDPKVDSLSASFICVKVDGDKDTGARSKYGVRGFPTTVFLDPKGEVIETVVGYRKPEEYLTVMRSVLEKSIGSAQAQKPKKTLDRIPAQTEEEYVVLTPSKDKGPKGNGGLRLSGISKTAKGYIAIINNAIVRKGDMVGEFEVLSVDNDGVKLQAKGSEVTLTM